MSIQHNVEDELMNPPVEFNEDLSAFHGPTLEAQKSYTAAAIDYILSLYPPSTPIIVMGHSMGGVVGTSLLPSDRISAIITMSTPHGIPPARFDSRMNRIYEKALKEISDSQTPIISICGGVTDTMIPSEFCILPEPLQPKENTGYRRTVFSSALEGCWTGVGHREMVWCHQIRWRVARATLELGKAMDSPARGRVFDKWLRDGLGVTEQSVNSKEEALDLHGGFEVLPNGAPLVLQSSIKNATYLMPIPESRGNRFVLYLSGGSIPPVSTAKPNGLSARIYACHGSDGLPSSCALIKAGNAKLIPNPSPYNDFPVSREGIDEADGVVVFYGNEHMELGDAKWIAVEVTNHDKGGWISARFESSTLQMAFFHRSIGKHH